MGIEKLQRHSRQQRWELRMRSESDGEHQSRNRGYQNHTWNTEKATEKCREPLRNRSEIQLDTSKAVNLPSKPFSVDSEDFSRTHPISLDL